MYDGRNHKNVEGRTKANMAPRTTHTGNKFVAEFKVFVSFVLSEVSDVLEEGTESLVAFTFWRQSFMRTVFGTDKRGRRCLPSKLLAIITRSP